MQYASPLVLESSNDEFNRLRTVRSDCFVGGCLTTLTAVPRRAEPARDVPWWCAVPEVRAGKLPLRAARAAAIPTSTRADAASFK